MNTTDSLAVVTAPAPINNSESPDQLNVEVIMMKCEEKFIYWLSNPFLSDAEKNELSAITGNKTEIEDRFMQDLNFGTGGLRGLIGIGSNRINRFTVNKASRGLANYLRKSEEAQNSLSVVIAYDTRHHSADFALESALVMAGNGIRAFLFPKPSPTPQLSFAVRQFQCQAGIVITASHNPPAYNGYKVYGKDGGQITTEAANAITKEIDVIDVFADNNKIKKEQAMAKGLLYMIGDEIDMLYLNSVLELSLRKITTFTASQLKLVYTPLHGTGLRLIRQVLQKSGYKNFYQVDSQSDHNSNFPTVKFPNPEEKEAYTQAIKIATQVDADIILATDPDCDRVGVAVKDTQEAYQILSGNQIGALLIDYIITAKGKINARHAVINTIVTSDFGGKIARSAGATVISTLTGFKYIGEKIKEFEERDNYEFLFGYEESHGYLCGNFVRDKDAVIASLLITEMAAYYKSTGLSLIDRLEMLYQEYGYYSDILVSHNVLGSDRNNILRQGMAKLRNRQFLKRITDDIQIIEDYSVSKRILVQSNQTESINLPPADVVKIYFSDGSWFAVRPSGTESKIKVYFSALGVTRAIAELRLAELQRIQANCFCLSY